MTPHESTHYVMLPGAGSSGLTWDRVAQPLDAIVLPLGDEEDVTSIARALLPASSTHHDPEYSSERHWERWWRSRSLVSSTSMPWCSSRRDSASTSASSALSRVTYNPPGLMDKMARLGIGDPDDAQLVSIDSGLADTRGPARALASLARPRGLPSRTLDSPPTSIVLWGPLDRSVPLEDHVELAMKMKGLLVPIEGSGHARFWNDQETTKWIRLAMALRRGRSARC